jgi:hypothetical protein
MVVNPASCTIESVQASASPRLHDIRWSEATEQFIGKEEDTLFAVPAGAAGAHWSLDVRSDYRLSADGRWLWITRPKAVDLVDVKDGHVVGAFDHFEANLCDGWTTPRVLVYRDHAWMFVESRGGAFPLHELDRVTSFACRGSLIVFDAAAEGDDSAHPIAGVTVRFGRIRPRDDMTVEILSPRILAMLSDVSLNASGTEAVISTSYQPWRVELFGEK